MTTDPYPYYHLDRAEARARRQLARAGRLAGLTARTADVLVYLLAHLVECQRPATTADLAARFGWASRNAAARHLTALAAAGHLARSARNSTPPRLPGVTLTARVSPPTRPEATTDGQ